MRRIKISKKLRMYLFAFIMSFLTSSTVSGVVIFFSVKNFDILITLWPNSIVKSWPIVFILIVIFVPLINKFLNYFFDEKT